MADLLISTHCDACKGLLAINATAGRVAVIIDGEYVANPVTVDADDLSWDCPRCGHRDSATIEEAAMRPLP